MCENLRLVFPQWQGGEPKLIDECVKDFDPKTKAQGYSIGSYLLNFLASKSETPTEIVPVSDEFNEDILKTEKEIYAYQILKKQLEAAFNILNIRKPKRIVTFGGECSVSIAPFTYLASLYKDDISLIWIDAHMDFFIQGDGNIGFHGMPMSLTLGIGEEEIKKMLPGSIDPSNVLLVGLRYFLKSLEERRKSMGIPYISPEKANESTTEIMDFLHKKGNSKVVIHFDLDSLDPSDLSVCMAPEPNGLKVNTVVKIFQEISKEYDIVGLTLSEIFPREVIKLRNLVHSIPVF
ncbi:Arginase family protein [Trichomonas vaginalis G3]|uniref:Arginase family protein n=1 Tax=Trichomonas vaginalis (strain ATCC PRA-98 / G3) TaxID=412133 RepID=A2FNL2_TRIV3|nr:arginase protein [Trichomonas vaginalis G3]EAX93512.1 Arginase family protein [Trichomonas vaginalis G3]KAI5511585.1 arginase protein [Trichomonas vaginalis G3]|eukprot:XP_001306442.1 Arginase family protein [Trichomonas vaginalis G3]